MTSRVYLIPGFFGFAHFGDLKYFHHVEELLTHELAGLGRNFQVIRVDTLAAGTLARRTARLREVLVHTAAGDTDPIHLVGHSTGALDARRLLDPERVRASRASSVSPAPTAARRSLRRSVRRLARTCCASSGRSPCTPFGSARSRSARRWLSLVRCRSSTALSAPRRI